MCVLCEREYCISAAVIEEDEAVLYSSSTSILVRIPNLKTFPFSSSSYIKIVYVYVYVCTHIKYISIIHTLFTRVHFLCNYSPFSINAIIIIKIIHLGPSHFSHSTTPSRNLEFYPPFSHLGQKN